MAGGRSFEAPPIEMIEIKPEPYVGERDKTRLVGVDMGQVKAVDC